MVYVSGSVQPLEVYEIRDSLLPFVTSRDALEIHRFVEMRQWVEQRQEDKVSFTQRWMSTYVQNMGYPEQYVNPNWSDEIISEQVTGNVRIGLAPYEIEKSWLDSIDALNPMQIEISERDKKEIQGTLNFFLSGDAQYVYLTQYHPSQSHSVGDYRIRYAYKPLTQHISVLAKQAGNKLVAGENGVVLVQAGEVDGERMIDIAIEEGSGNKWPYRILFTLLAILGCFLVYFKIF